MALSPVQRLEADVRAALKSGEKERLSTLRLLLAAVRNEQLEKGVEVDEAGFLAIVRRSIKRGLESIAQYEAGGRAELVAKERAEIAVLEGCLPPQADENEIRAAIAERIAAEGLAGPAAIGPIMKAMRARFGGAADGATINRLARELLSGKP
jgi:uncharacterized protein YqeY